jgi:anionic cell wall polymer biosynthesis LytR-Cps2A-Psr (LCP) family protein
MPNITDPKLIRKSEEQMIFMMVTDVKNSTKYVTAFSVEIDKYAQLVIPGCKYYF